MSSIWSFDIISVVLPDPKVFLGIPLPAADAAALNPKGIKTFLANGLIAFFNSGNLVFSNGSYNLPRKHPDRIIVDNWDFDSLISVDKYLIRRKFGADLIRHRAKMNLLARI